MTEEKSVREEREIRKECVWEREKERELKRQIVRGEENNIEWKTDINPIITQKYKLFQVNYINVEKNQKYFIYLIMNLYSINSKLMLA